MSALASSLTKNLEFAVFARDLFEKNYRPNLAVQADNLSLIVRMPSDPHVIGLTLRSRLQLGKDGTCRQPSEMTGSLIETWQFVNDIFAPKPRTAPPIVAPVATLHGREILADDLEVRKGDIDLSDDERAAVSESASTNAKVLHEVVRSRGDEELSRPAFSLIWSALAAGVAISASLLGQSLLESMLPDAPWRPLIASLGYSLGFVIVILGRLQLFTESTLSAVLPVATHPSWGNLGRLLRLWGLVLAFNLIGTLLIAFAIEAVLIGSSEQRAAMLDVSRKLLEHDWLATMKLGIPAGFLIAAVPWLLPAARGQSFWVVLTLTYFIALGGFAHVVAGSGEAWLLAAAGEISFSFAMLNLIVPALFGNIIGGTGLFALLAHAQVRQEL